MQSTNVHGGTYAISGYDNYGYATLSQTFATSVGATYDFSFWTKAYSTNFGNKLSYSIGDSGVFSVGTTTDWLNTVGTFAATSTTSTIAIFFETNSGTGTWNIDDVYVDTSVVPVPAAAWLFGSGLLGLIGVARRKKT